MLTVLEKVDFLQQAELFHLVRTESLSRLAAIAREACFEPRQQLFSEHESPESVYVVLEGEVELIRAGQQVCRLGRSAVAGARSLLAESPQAETAVATRPTRVLRISQADLHDAMSEDIHITRGILRALLAGGAGAR